MFYYAKKGNSEILYLYDNNFGRKISVMEDCIENIEVLNLDTYSQEFLKEWRWIPTAEFMELKDKILKSKNKVVVKNFCGEVEVTLPNPMIESRNKIPVKDL